MEQKYKLQVVASFCLNEEVKSAAFGSLKLAKQEQAVPVIDQKRVHFVQKITVRADDVQMSEEELTFDDKFELMMRTDLHFAKT